MTMHGSQGSHIVRCALTVAVIIACHVTPNATTGMVTILTTTSEENVISSGVRQGTTPNPFNSTNNGNHTARNCTQDNDGCLDSDSTVTQMSLSLHSESGTEVTGVNQFNTFKNKFGGHRSDDLYLNYSDCINRIVQHRITGSEGSIFWSVKSKQQVNHVSTFCAVELIVPNTMVARVQIAGVNKMTRYGSVSITVLDYVQTVLTNGSLAYLPRFFFSYSSVVVFNMTVNKTSKSFFFDVDLQLNITTLPMTRRPQLSPILTSSTTGYLETLHWNSSESLPPFTKTSVQIKAPDNHMVVIHLQILQADCSYYAGSLTLRSENNTLRINTCDMTEKSCTARAFYSGKVDVTYVTYLTYQGFETSKSRDIVIKFYFYPISQPPVQLTADRWSCATVNWRDVKQPWSCIFVFGCSGHEDGVGCWQADGNLQQGLIQVDGRCFAVSGTHEGEVFIWNSESEWCRRRGGQLASLTTTQLLSYLPETLQRLGFGNSFVLGLKGAPTSTLVMYRNSLLWSDGTVAHFANYRKRTAFSYCITAGGVFRSTALVSDDCTRNLTFSYHLCQIPHNLSPYRNITLPVLSSPRFRRPAYIQCPESHFTHVFLACDKISHCWLSNNGLTSSCAPPLKSLPLLFKCADTQQSVPYTLVCNHREDCKDGSDETFCYFPPCDVTSLFTCDGKRCVQTWEHCDKQVDCDDRADEDGCFSQLKKYNYEVFYFLEKIMNFEKDNFDITTYILPGGKTQATIFFCPDSHFLCVSLPYICLPVYFRCNGIYDCPDHEDEAACDTYTCPGFYRCRGFQVCVHESHLCDGVYHCPQRDDEILCNETCPHHCICHGWAFICSDIIHGSSYPNLRYLDASETRMTLAEVDNHTSIVYLSLARCNLTTLHEVSLQNLRILELSRNKLTHITAAHFAGLKNIQVLKISENHLKVFSFYGYLHKTSLKTLDITNNRITVADFGTFDFLPNLTLLNISRNHLNHVTGEGFPKLNDLRVIDVRFCPMTIFPRGIFKALGRLETVYADTYKLCCSATLPQGFNVLNCHAPSDEVSSCDDLLRSNLYRVGLAIFASLALAGNVSSLLYRLIFHRTSSQAGYDIFVTNLCMADLLMGVYLSIIGIADQKYKGAYLWEDLGWRHSILCKMAGFICLLSSEVSVFIIFLITVDRFLVLRFPFHHMHFKKRSARFACTTSWLVGLVLAVIPLLPVTSHWQFYTLTSICIPLPTSRIDFSGRGYLYGVKVILNFILFICVFFGQISIYWSVHSNSISAACTSKDSKELNIARRLITVTMLNLLCVFPVCVIGFLASNSEIPFLGEVNIGISIFVLPLNSALNPFLYTINIYLERRRRSREAKRRKYLMAQLNFANNVNRNENSKVKMTRRDALDFIRMLLSIRALSPEDLTRISQDKA